MIKEAETLFNWHMLNIATALIYRYNPEFEVLFIDRNKMPYRNYFAFPGGKIKYGETIKSALLREIFEETAIDDHDIISWDYIGMLNELYFHREKLVNHFILNYYGIEVRTTTKTKESNEGQLVWITLKSLSEGITKKILPSDYKILSHFIDSEYDIKKWFRIEGILTNNGSREEENLELTKWETMS